MSKRAGFTLIELLVVIAIIALLSSVILATLSETKRKARDMRRIADMKQITLALELYKDRFGNYPGDTYSYNEGEDPDCGGFDTSAVDWNGDGMPFISPIVTAGIMQHVPGDPAQTSSATNCSTDFMYRYYRYSAGLRGCPIERGDFYVLQVVKFESIGTAKHPSSPGFVCSGQNWSNGMQYATGGYQN